MGNLRNSVGAGGSASISDQRHDQLAGSDPDVVIDLTSGQSSEGPADARSQKVPFLELRHDDFAAEILEAWKRILHSARFVGGAEVDAFETEFAAYIGSEYAVGVGSGTDALHLSLVAMGIQEGDEVITVPHTFVATAEAIVAAGGKPVFVDVDSETGTMDPSKVEAAITARTRVLLPVHLYGQAADMKALGEIADRHGLDILEDACQAVGAGFQGRRVGTFGWAAAFSFYPGKNLGACGDAGAVTTDDAGLAERVRMLRDHGQVKKYDHALLGTNSRLDALQAAALRVKLPRLDGWNEQRRQHADLFRSLLDGYLELPTEVTGRRHVYHLFVVRHPDRRHIIDALGRAGIGTGLHYPVPVHLQRAFADASLGEGSFPESERWAREGFSLPMFPQLTVGQIGRVSNEIIAALSGHRVFEKHSA